MAEYAFERFFKSCAVLALLAAALLPGCRGRHIDGLVPASGTVIYEGAPLPWATMTFAPDASTPSGKGARVSTAMTDAEGKFTVTTLGVKGAVPGDYLVAVEKYIPAGENAVENWERERQNPGFKEPAPEEEVFNVVSAIPLKYANKKTSELKIAIEPKGSKKIEIELRKD